MNFKDLIDEMKLLLEEVNEPLKPLLEFALPMKKIESKIEDVTPQTILHLYKILAFGDKHPTTVHHWCAELGAWLSSFCTLLCKSTNKPLSVDRIVKCMLTVYSDVSEFKSLGGKLYSEYGYSDKSEEELYESTKKILPHLINYIQKLDKAERPNPNNIAEIIEKFR